MSAGQMKGKTCYTEEWKRSNPDFAVYLPKEAIGQDTDNVHFLVIETPGEDLLQKCFETDSRFGGGSKGLHQRATGKSIIELSSLIEC